MSESGGDPTVYTIPPGQPFVDALAAGVSAQYGNEPADLARITILLPTRRAVRGLRDAFLRRSQGHPLLLPRMRPLGDLDEDELAISGWEDVATGEVAADIPPAISGLRRQLLLTSLIRAAEPETVTEEQCARLATELARLLDQVQTERKDFADLADLVDQPYAEHWQITLEFLRIVTERWPRILEEEGAIDPAERRNRVLEAQARIWQRDPPPDPVIAAGSTGTIPATADLLDSVARLPAGCVVLPGLDTGADRATWEALEQSHPQYGMARLLERLGVDPMDVTPWPAPDVEGTPPQRAATVNRALRPAETAADGYDLEAPGPEALADISRIDAADPGAEAEIVALIMRDALRAEKRTAALITPDRHLARRVAQELRRWDIEIDDSAGLPLAETPPGAFLRLVAELAAEDFAPVPLLAAFKHPLAAGGIAPARFRAMTRRLETAALRGPRPAAGLAGLRAAVADAERVKDKNEILDWLDGLAGTVDELAELLDRKSVPLADLVQAHVRAAEALAASDDQTGAARLWADEAGEAAAAFVGELIEAAGALGAVAGHGYPSLFDALMAGRAVRPRYGRHPRLQIWGLLEARLQHADRVILGGLNEGTWPPEAHADAWMSRPMREKFGLPLPERRIGLTAHDFAQAFSAPAVFMTRAKRVDGTPTVPSRWLLRLDNLLDRMGEQRPHFRDPQWSDYQSLLDRPEAFVAGAPPEPRPPVEARPRRLSVTQIETWMRDPYGIYARHVLGLEALAPIDAAPDAAGYGTLIHRALDAFVAAYPESLPNDAEARLIEIGRKVFDHQLSHPGVWAFWWPRFERIAAWFVAMERERRARLARAASEIKGTLTLEGPAGAFELSAIADRIDLQADGALTIVDYKTGAVPSAKEIKAGFAPQLPLEAAMARAGAFPGLPKDAAVEALEYWRLQGGRVAGEISPAKENADALADAALRGLSELIARFDDAETPYHARPRPSFAPAYSDYEHLARIKEWTASDGGRE